MARLQKAGYWLMSTTNKDLMDFDGSQWIPGVNPNGQCHLVRVTWMRTVRKAFLQNGTETGELRPR